MNIPARVNVITLGVRDLEKMRAFYLGLGWRERAHYPTFSMFDTGGALLALFPFDMLAEDGRVAADQPQPRYRGFSLALNVARRELVDEVIGELRARGVGITKDPEDAEWGGRSAYFVDPEDNLWEVAWNPNGTFDKRGAFIPEHDSFYE